MWDFISSFIRDFLVPAAIGIGGQVLTSQFAPEPEFDAPQFDVFPTESFETIDSPQQFSPIQNTNPTQGVQGQGTPVRPSGSQSFTGGFGGLLPPGGAGSQTTGYSQGFGTLDQGSLYSSSRGARQRPGRPGFYGI